MDAPMTVPLSLATLPHLAAAVARPTYDRAGLSAGILHVGVGNFHRAHQARYLHDLFQAGADHDWAIVGAGIKPFDAARREALGAQDWLTTVVELSPDALQATVTGAMVDFLPVDPQAILARLDDPAIRIVSLTLTEGGYYVDAGTGGFDADHADIRADAAAPGSPRTVFGILVAALRARRDAGVAPFTVMSCDNLPENGHVARAAVEGLARLIDPELADWIASDVAFPSGMVDCITPATSPAEIAMVADTFGIADAAPVTCEPFRQWVLEDRFPAGRPALERVGVQFVPDVVPYETMKLRILNAGHAAIAYAGAMLGHVFAHEAMGDPDVEAWLRALMTREVIPILPEVPGLDHHAYLDLCIDRFGNPRVKDTVARLCLDGSNRQPKFVLPSVADALRQGRDVRLLALEVALWCRFCAATAQPDATLALEDARAPAMQAAALATRDDPGAFLALTDIFGGLAGEPAFADAFAEHMAALWSDDVRSVLRARAGS